MRHPDPFLSDDWKNIPRIDREVRLDADGALWIGQCDPAMRERIREVYRRLCETGETGRQIVAVDQEIIADLDALIRKKQGRTQDVRKRQQAERSQVG